MIAILQAVSDGLLVGGVYGVIAVGLSLVFGVLGIVNFAQAEFMMLGMYAAWFAWRYLGLDPIVGSLLSFVSVFCLGVVVQRLLIQRVMKAPPVAQIFLTVGILIVLENGALLLFGPDFRSVKTDYQTQALKIGPLFVSVGYLVAFIAAVIVSVGLWFMMAKTWIGRAIRATAQNPVAAAMFGVDVRWIYAIAFGLGTGLSALGGGIILANTSVSSTSGSQYVVLMFTVVVLGGLGSVMGALAGGLIVGMIQSLSTLIMPIQLQNLALFAIFIAFLAFRPQGLLGRCVAMKRSLILIAAAACAVLVLGFELAPRGYAVRVVCLVLMAATLGQCWNIVGGLANQISLGHAAFFGVGAYTSTMLQVKYGLSPWIGLPIGMLLAVLLSVLLSIPTLRLKGPYFSLATLAFGEACRIVATSATGLTGGPQGVVSAFRRQFMDHAPVSRAGSYIPVFTGLFVIVSIVFVLLAHGRLGYMLRAIRENEDAAEVAGINYIRRPSGGWRNLRSADRCGRHPVCAVHVLH